MEQAFVMASIVIAFALLANTVLLVSIAENVKTILRTLSECKKDEGDE
jgi:multisubunit Na+/H+ antiporter MnhC subunit